MSRVYPKTAPILLNNLTSSDSIQSLVNCLTQEEQKLQDQYREIRNQLQEIRTRKNDCKIALRVIGIPTESIVEAL